MGGGGGARDIFRIIETVSKERCLALPPQYRVTNGAPPPPPPPISKLLRGPREYLESFRWCAQITASFLPARFEDMAQVMSLLVG